MTLFLWNGEGCIIICINMKRVYNYTVIAVIKVMPSNHSKTGKSAFMFIELKHKFLKNGMVLPIDEIS